LLIHIVRHSTVMKTLIYPMIEVIDTNVSFELRTTLRKEKDGKWYDWVHIDRHKKYDDIEFTCEDKIKSINRFHSQVYNTIVLGQLNTEQKNMYGESLFQESERQHSEEERLKQLLMW
jgi:hypothetical protein